MTNTKSTLSMAAIMLTTLTLIAPSQAVTLAKDGRSDYQIVTPSKPSPAVEYAAKELQDFLTQAAGVRLPVVSEIESGDAPSILLGPCEKTRKAGLLAEAAKLREDGVIIKTLGSNIALLGQNERGNLYCVYVLLEKYLGVRFLAGDCTIVPKQKDITLPKLDYSYSPPFMYRETLYFDSFPKEIAARQRLNGPYTKCDASVGGKMEFFPYVHSFNSLIPEKEYFKDHPEYFGMQGGKRVAGPINAQLCLANPDVLRIAKERVLKWIDENPNIPIFDISQNDGGGPCECDKCMAIVKEEGSQHGPILRFVNAIADVVAEKHPDKWIETLAYAYAIKPPAITKPRDNVIIRLCHVGCYFHGFEQCNMGADFASLVDQWGKLTRRIFIWHYATNFGHYLAPNPNLASLAKDIKFYGSHNVNGVMVQGNYQGSGGELAELRQYLCAQLMWNPDQDPMQIRDDFCRGYYGKAADDVLEFLRLMDTTSRQPIHAFANWNPKTTVSPQFAQDALKLLQKARKASENPTERNRVGKLMLPFWYMMLTNQSQFGLSDKDAAAMWPRAKQVIVDNKIDFIREDNSGGGNATAWMFEMDGRFAPAAKDMVFDLGKIDVAKIMYCTDWRTSSVPRNGRMLRSIFHHPDGKQHNGEATYEIALPALPQDTKLVMRFATVINNKTQDGVRFAVLVNGNELWNETKTTSILPEQATAKTAHDNILPKADPFTDHSLDLSKYAGQTIKLTLQVNARANNANDWANWVEPRIVTVKSSAASKQE